MKYDGENGRVFLQKRGGTYFFRTSEIRRFSDFCLKYRKNDLFWIASYKLQTMWCDGSNFQVFYWWIIVQTWKKTVKTTFCTFFSKNLGFLTEKIGHFCRKMPNLAIFRCFSPLWHPKTYGNHLLITEVNQINKFH